jgi:RNA polymerase sigma-70 factor (ECF subfamily)
MTQEEQRKTGGKQTAVEAGLVRRIRGGDPKAFEELFEANCAALVNLAQRYVIDQATAEGVVQDVFVNTWKRREQLDPEGNIRAYLHTAVRNQALKQLRRVKVEQRGESTLAEIRNGGASPEEEWTREELARAIQRAIERLPTRCRTIFVMSRYERLTYKEIAQLLGLSIKTVETQMGRALQILRRSLSHLTGHFQ